jgi:hypothetical protein
MSRTAVLIGISMVSCVRNASLYTPCKSQIECVYGYACSGGQCVPLDGVGGAGTPDLSLPPVGNPVPDLASWPPYDLLGWSPPDLTNWSPPDLTWQGGGPPDLKTLPPDLAKAPPGCWAILTQGASATKATATTKAILNGWLSCEIANCGDSTVDSGTNLPCSTLVDGGPSAACNLCFQNIQVNSQISFTDPNTMKPITCQPNSSAPTCGKCGDQIVACVLDCNSDKDCAGLASGGTPTSCDPVSHQCS